MKILIRTLSASFVLAVLCAASAHATEPVPGHPRVNEVDQRLDNQQRRIDAGVADGTITPAQAARDERRDAAIAERASAAEARHGGHLTAGETRRLNRAENRNSRAIHRQRQH